MKRFLWSSVVAVVISCTATHAANKVNVCHIPPGNPWNFHTITISENAFAAHLAHGDLGGACNDLCAELCDDGDACTIDDTGDCEQAGCPTTPAPVDCNDQNECTEDSCDAIEGCINPPRVGETCDDGEICTDQDACNAAGVCEGQDVPDCCEADGECSQNPCDQAYCDLEINRCVEDPVVCEAPDACTVAECAPDTGECVASPIVCGENETCDICSGECRTATACPCWSPDELAAVVTQPIDEPRPYMAGFEELWLPDQFCNDSINFDDLFAPVGQYPFYDFGCATLNTLTWDILVAFFQQDPPPWIPCQTYVAGDVPGAILWPFSPWFQEEEQPQCLFNRGDGCYRNISITVEELATCHDELQAQGSAAGFTCFASEPCSGVVCDPGQECNPSTGACEACGAYDVIGLGTFAEFRTRAAWSINESNDVVGSASSATVVERAFLWTSGTAYDLGELPGGDERGWANDINDSGHIVGQSYGPNGARAVEWLPGSPFSPMSLIDPGSALDSISLAIGINNAGDVVGRNDLGLGPWLREAGLSAVELAVLPGNQGDLGQAEEINDARYVVGGVRDPGGAPHQNYAVIWDPSGSITDLGTAPGATEAAARAINAARTVVGESWFGDNQQGGFRRATVWTFDGAMHTAALLPGIPGLDGHSNAQGLNDSGDIVGWIQEVVGGTSHAVRWRDGIAEDLNDLIHPASGWFLRAATDVNEAGVIVGLGVNPAGDEEAFMLTPGCLPADPCTGVVCDAGEECNPATGLCVASCPCWSLEELEQALLLPQNDIWPRTLGHIPPVVPTDESHEFVLADFSGWVPADACNDNLDPYTLPAEGTTCTTLNSAPQAVLDQFCTEFFCSYPLEVCDWPIASVSQPELPNGSAAAFVVARPEQFGGADCVFFPPSDPVRLMDLTPDEAAVCQAQIQAHGAAGGWSCY